jgi:hypothetical protein
MIKLKDLLKEDVGRDSYLGGIAQALKKAGIRFKKAQVMKGRGVTGRADVGFFITLNKDLILPLEIRKGYVYYEIEDSHKLGKWTDTNKVARALKKFSKMDGFGQGKLVKKEGKLTEKVKYKKDKKIDGKWYTKQGTHKAQAKANILAKREFGRYYDTKVVKEKGGYTIYVKPLKEGKLTEGISVADTRFVGKFVIHILSSGNEMRSAILSKKNNSKYGTRDKKDLKTLWDLAGKYKGKEIKEGKLNEKMDRKKAAVLLKQLGGNRFIAMTGAKGFAFSNKYMSFKIGRNSKGINFVRIAHNAKDLYDMEFGFVSVKGIKVKKKVKDVYADMLGTMFTKYTGMNVRL